MFKSKLAKSLILGLSLSVVLSAAAYAQSEKDQEVKIQIEQVGGGTDAVVGLAPDTPVVYDGNTSEAFNPVSDEMYQKQSEIDKVLFEEYKQEISQKGFTVTNTSATDEYVEIGITPFNEENASYINEIVGNDEIKVVEGFQAIPYSDGAADSEELMYATGVPVEDILLEEAPAEDANIVLAQDDVQVVSATAETVSAHLNTTSSATLIAGISAAVLAVLGGLLVMKRRMKATR